MVPHVFVRLSGHGLLIVPRSPFLFELHADGQAVVVTHVREDGVRRVTVRPAGPDAFLELAPGTTDPDEVCTVSAGGRAGPWYAETTEFAALWPAAFALSSALDDGPFDLRGPAGAVVYVQGPLRAVPALARLAAEGQAVVGEETHGKVRLIDLRYDLGGKPWAQRHCVAPLGKQVVVVSSQAPAKLAGIAAEVALLVAESVEAATPPVA